MQNERDGDPQEGDAHNPEAGDASDGWYFDLPTGAWERQEQKNRELRERVRQNVEEPRRPRVFGAAPEPERRPRLGFGRRRDALPGSPPPQQGDFDWDGAFDEDEPGPVEAWDGPSHATAAAPAAAPEPGSVETEPPAWDAASEEQHEPATAEAPAEPQSRWEAMFSAPAEGSIIDGMRQWAQAARPAGERRRLTPAARQDDPPAADDDQPAPPARDIAPEPPSPERDEEPFGANEEEDFVGSMRAWAQQGRRTRSGHPRLAPLPAEDVPTEEPGEEDGLAAMRAWATRKDRPAPPPPVEEPEPARTAFEVAAIRDLNDEEWGQSIAAVDTGGWEEVQPEPPAARAIGRAGGEPEQKKPGLLGRLFGRRRAVAPLPQEVSPVAWLPGEPAQAVRYDERWEAPVDEPAVDHEPDEVPGESPWEEVVPAPEPRSLAQRELPAAPPDDAGEWTWESLGALVQEPGSADGPPATAAEPVSMAVDPPGLDALDDDDPWAAARLFEAEDDAAPVPMPSAAAPFATTPNDDEPGWDPEPFDADLPGTMAAADPVSGSFDEPAEDESRPVWEPAASVAEPSMEPDITPGTLEAPVTAADPESFVAEPAGESRAEDLPTGTPDETAEWPAFASAAIDDDDRSPVAPEPAPMADAADPDDPWSAIAQATGIAVDDDLPPPPPVFDRPPSSRPFLSALDPLAYPDAWEAEPPRAESEAAEPETSEATVAPAIEPAWEPVFVPQTPEDERDLVLRAFEAHARAAGDDEDADSLPPAAAEPLPRIEALLGEDAEELVEEAGSAEEDPFAPQGWAPQRTIYTDDEDPAPWAARARSTAEARAVWSPTIGVNRVDDEEAALPPWVDPDPLDDAAPSDEPHRSRSKTVIREFVETGLLAILVFLSVRASFQNFKVDGTSMYPTLENGQFLIVNKLVYSEVDLEELSRFLPFIDPGDDPKRYVFHGPQRGDIIVLKDPRKPDTDLIKRVIGLPGETIEIVEGRVYINDYLLEEPYIKTVWHDNRPKITIPPGEYFVMGDNRDNSLDSRNPTVGLVPSNLIIGKAMLSYWPASQFGFAPNEEGAISDQQRPRLTTQRLER